MKLLFSVWSFQNLNLLRQFFLHYEKLGVTDFYCIFHTYGMEDNTIYDFVKEKATIVFEWNEPYVAKKDTFLRNKFKREIADSEQEWIWNVDADEFVNITKEELQDLLSNDSANYVNGWLVDRFSPLGLIPAENTSVLEQFPLRTFFSREKLKGCAFKIPLTRAYVILYTGHHAAVNTSADGSFTDDRPTVPANPSEEQWVEVAHVKWHEGILEEIYNKFLKTALICEYESRELGIFVLEYCYKKKSIQEITYDVTIDDKFQIIK